MFLVWDWRLSRPEQVNSGIFFFSFFFIVTDVVDSSCLVDEAYAERRLQKQTRGWFDINIIFIQYTFQLN